MAARAPKRSNKRTHSSASELQIQEQFQTSRSKNDRQRKTWSIHDLKSFKPLNDTQREFMYEFAQDQQILAIGSAGTGKTYLSVAMALYTLLTNPDDYDKIIIVRSAVPSRDIGFMPGTLEEKTAFYETPYVDIFSDLMGYERTYEDMKAAGKVQFMTTSFVRGLTFDRAIIIVDEAQSATFHELYSVITRVGRGSRIVICGDTKQDDLHSQKGSNRSGLSDLLKVAEKMEVFSVVKFTEQDIVRSGFVKEFIISCQQYL